MISKRVITPNEPFLQPKYCLQEVGGGGGVTASTPLFQSSKENSQEQSLWEWEDSILSSAPRTVSQGLIYHNYSVLIILHWCWDHVSIDSMLVQVQIGTRPSLLPWCRCVWGNEPMLSFLFHRLKGNAFYKCSRSRVCQGCYIVSLRRSRLSQFRDSGHHDAPSEIEIWMT